jgi:biotin carboxyl carrier protein
MLKITSNNQTFDIENNLLNGTPFDWDMTTIGDGRFHVIRNNVSYNVEVIEANYTEKTFKIKVNQHIYNLTAKDRFDILLDQMGMGNTTKTKINHIKAPMPGLIWDIKVAVGDTVKAGDTVLILVAMKMENALKLAGDGVVKNIKIKQGDSVEKNQVLIEFE